MERMDNMKKRMLPMLLCLLLLCPLCVPVLAAEAIDPEQEGTLDVHISLGDGTDVSGMQVDLYRVAEVQSDGEVLLCGAFAALETEISLAPTDDWAVITTGAANLVRRTGLKPEQSVCLNENGVAHFPEPGKKLTAGIYLVFPRTMETARGRAGCSPTLAALPLADEGWNYNVQVSPKVALLTAQDYLEVLKVWEDDGQEKKRPESVIVDLYCDDVLVDTQELTAQMQWKYRWDPVPVWKALGQNGNGPGSDVTIEGEHSWYVVERKVSGYKTKYAISGGRCFVITNTANKKPAPSGGKLPQTGVLWWPVPVLALAGLSLLCLGRVMDKRERLYE